MKNQIPKNQSTMNIQASENISTNQIKESQTDSVLLAPVIQVLWDSRFKNGLGVNAVTGQSSATAVEPFEIPLEEIATQSFETGKWISNKSDYEVEVATSASGTYNIGGTKLSSSANYVSKIKYSETSMTLIAKYEKENQEYDLPSQNPVLTDTAITMMSENPSEFRDIYGDYFVQGFKRMSKFSGMYVCTSKSVSDMENFSAEVKAVSNVWSAEGSAEFTRIASKNSISVEYSIYQVGLKPGVTLPSPSSSEDIIKALNIFKENEIGIKYYASLAHYATLKPNYSRAISLNPTAFVELKLLYSLGFDVDTRYNTCPLPYKTKHKPTYTNLNSELNISQPELATDSELRAKLTEAYREFYNTLNNVFDRQDFYYKVRDSQSNEPKTGSRKYAEGSGGKNKEWNYGKSTALSNTVIISSTPKSIKKDYKFGNTGKKSGTLTWDEDAKKLYVGWKVKSNKENNGNWRKSTDGFILLNDKGKISFTGQELRGIKWAVTLYYVDAIDYQFE